MDSELWTWFLGLVIAAGILTAASDYISASRLRRSAAHLRDKPEPL